MSPAAPAARAVHTCVRLARAGATIVTIDACGPVGSHIGYAHAEPEDLAETVRLVEDEGARSTPTASTSATWPTSSA